MFKSIRDEAWFFNCEWIPDVRTGRRLYSLSKDMDNESVIREMLVQGGCVADGISQPLKTSLCRVVSIAAVVRRVAKPGTYTDIEDKVRLSLIWLPRNVSDVGQSAEGAVIGSFLNAVCKFHPQLVGFNSKTSDLRILLERAFVNGISAPGFCRRPEKIDGVDYFATENEYNIDLLETFSGSSNDGVPSLSELAIAAGIPGKFENTQSKLTTHWLSGNWHKIVEQNCFEALTTYLVWLRTAHLGGFLTDEEYECEQMILENYLASEIEEKPEMAFLEEYLNEWNRLQLVE